VQVRKIAKDTIKDFPELIKSGYTQNDISRVWDSYEDEMNSFLLNPSKPYYKFFGSFYFTMHVNKIKKVLKNQRNYISKESMLIEPNYEKQIERLNKIKNILLQKKSQYHETIYYLKDWNTEKSKRSTSNLEMRIKKTEDLITECNSLIEHYDKRIITRDLEKQSSNSRGN